MFLFTHRQIAGEYLIHLSEVTNVNLVIGYNCEPLTIIPLLDLNASHIFMSSSSPFFKLSFFFALPPQNLPTLALLNCKGKDKTINIFQQEETLKKWGKPCNLIICLNYNIFKLHVHNYTVPLQYHKLCAIKYLTLDNGPQTQFCMTRSAAL